MESTLTKAFEKPLVVLEMANNHMGDVEHGLKIIRDFKEITAGFPYDFAFKFQYRQLETFIHPRYEGNMDIKYIKRFSETELSEEQFITLKNEATKLGFRTICTPFDNESVEKVVNHGYDFIKVASCSFTDWPLLEEIVKYDKPIIASTAGATYEEIDNVVLFLSNRKKDFAIMHCVAEYPTKQENQQLNQMAAIKKRHENLTIGFSTHEDPTNVENVFMAVAMGARIFEKHVGVPTNKYKINNYSATPEQFRDWLQAMTRAFEALGTVDATIRPVTEDARASLHALRRGVFAKTDLKAGDVMTTENALYAIPTIENQVVANDCSKYSEIKLTADVKADEPIIVGLNAKMTDKREQVMNIMSRVRSLVKESGIHIPKKISTELSHHFGLANFEKVGCTILNVINREYCKKIIVCLPNQEHPEQYHERKEEAFHLIYGELDLVLNGVSRAVKPGEIVVVERGTRHAFSSKGGAVVEEISSTHIKDDSYYTDPNIAKNKNRKTHLNYWM